jgi:hypothetical protein
MAALPGAGDARAIGIVVPTQVNYCVRAARLRAVGGVPEGTPGAFSVGAGGDPAVRARFAASGGDDVVASALRTGFLWERVRVQGGAYGGFVNLSSTSGSMSFASYRDPHVDNTLRSFDAAAAWLAGSAREAAFREDLRKAVISSIGGIDAPLSPSERGAVSTSRYISGVTEEMMQHNREGVLRAGAEDAEALAERMANAFSGDGVHTCVVGSAAAFAASKEKWRMFAPLQK